MYSYIVFKKERDLGSTFCSTNKKHVSPLQSILTQFSIRYL